MSAQAYALRIGIAPVQQYTLDDAAGAFHSVAPSFDCQLLAHGSRDERAQAYTLGPGRRDRH